MTLPVHVESALLSSIRQYITRIEWLDWNENVTGDYTAYAAEGSISVDTSRDVRRTFDIVINNASGLFVPNGSLTNMGVKVRLLRAIQTSQGPYFWKKGIYALSDPEAIHRGAEASVTLTGVDKWALLNGELGGTLTETTIIPQGTNVAEAIMAVAAEAGEAKFAFDICTAVTPYEITKEPGDVRADLIKELALIPSWEIFYDVEGYLRFRPITDPLQKQVVADFSAGGTYRKLYVSSQYNPEWTKVKNYWKVIGYSDPDTGIIYTGTAQDNNPNSPTNTSTPPAGVGLKTEVLTDDNLTTNDLCEQRSAYELRQNLRRVDRSSHDLIPAPFLLEGDCVQFEDDLAGIGDDKYEIQSVNEPLGLGLMAVECWKVVSVFEVVLASNFQGGLGNWQQLQSGVVDVVGLAGDNALRKQTYADPSGGYCLLSKSAVDFELIVFTRRDVLGSQVINQYSVANSSGNGYGIGLSYFGELRVEKRVGWVFSILKSAPFVPALGQWYTLRLSKVGNALLAEVHNGKTLEFGSPLASAGISDDAYTSFDRVAVNGGYVYYSDDVTVRKLL